MIQTKDSTDLSDFHMSLITRSESVSWPTPFTSNNAKLTISHTLTSMDSRPSTRIKQKSRNGARNTIFSWHQTQLLSKSPNFSVTFWSSSANSPSPWLKEKRSKERSMKLDTQ
jgi:hypothetical protein